MSATFTPGAPAIEDEPRATVAVTSPRGAAPAGLRAVLVCLTMTTGLVDAVCYLGMGHVLVANMTGNIVFLGFAEATRRRWLIAASGIQTALATAAAVGVAAGALGPTGPARLVVIALLGAGTGMQNATIRRLAIPDLTTTVLNQRPVL